MDPLTAALAGLSTAGEGTSLSNGGAAGAQQAPGADAPAAAPGAAAAATGGFGPRPPSDSGRNAGDAGAGAARSPTVSPSGSSASLPIAVPSTPAGPPGRASGGGGGGAAPPLSPPDPELAPEVLDQLMQQASPAISDARFSMEEFLKNKARLATAARRELVGGVPPRAEDDDVGSCLEGSGHEAELSRQAAHLASVAEGVVQESKVNRDLAALLVERLDSSRRALECLLRLLTTLMEAEAAYTAAMAAAAKAAAAGPLAAPADSGGLAAAVEGLVQLPAAAAAGHRQLYLELQLLVDGVRGLWRKYNAAAKELKQAVATAQRSVDACCKQLASSFQEHRSACEAFDASVVWQSTRSGATSGSATPPAHALQQQQQQHRRGMSAGSCDGAGDAWAGAAASAAAAAALQAGAGRALRPRFASAPAKDPWATEGRLVAEQQALQKHQDQERELLQKGFDTLRSLEAERIEALVQAGHTLAHSYCLAVEGLPAAAQGLKGMLGDLEGAGEAGVQHLAQVAEEMHETSRALAERQSDAVSNVSQELFCSPEIIRQGPMQLWQPRASSWGDAHFVLTRAGFLHWFASMEDAVPQEPPLNLCRCSFEAGQAPIFHLVESSGGSWLVGRGSRKVTLQAASVEECCEWAIALREAIALSSSTGAAATAAGGAAARVTR